MHRLQGMDGPILVTGAAGFVGSRLRERLLAEGADVRGIDRATDLGRDIVASDISEPEAWQAAAEGCATVVHTAAVVSNAVSDEVQYRTNVLGTRHVLDAAVRAGAKRFIHLSSVRVYGDLDFPDGVEEAHPVRPEGIPYVDTKIAAEQVVLQAHAAGEIECVIVRPGDVYGPGSRPWTVLPLEAIRSNRFALPRMGRGVFSPLYIDNLLDALLLAIEAPETAGEVFNITDGAGISCREFFGRYYEMLGKSGPPVLPTAAAMGLVTLNEVGSRVAAVNTEVNRISMRYLAREGTYSIEKARRLLGYEPKVGLDEGMAATEAWLQEHGLLRGRVAA